MALTTPASPKPRNWTDYRPDDNTFLDQDTGQRVHPDGTPVSAVPSGPDPFDLAVREGRIPGLEASTEPLPLEPIAPFRPSPGIYIPGVSEELRRRRFGEPTEIIEEPTRPATPDVIGPGKFFQRTGERLRPTPLVGEPLGAVGGAVSEKLGAALDWWQRNLTEPTAGLGRGLGIGLPEPDIEAARSAPLLGFGAGEVLHTTPERISREAISEISERVKQRDPQSPTDFLIALWQEAGNYERERPEVYPGSKLVGQMFLDPLNLIGLGWEPNLARALTSGARQGLTAVGRDALRTGEAIGRAEVGAAEQLGLKSAETARAGRKATPDEILERAITKLEMTPYNELSRAQQKTLARYKVELGRLRRTTKVPETSPDLTPADIHATATAKGVPYDNDPAFMSWSKQITGKEHLDDMTPQELGMVQDALNRGETPTTVPPSSLEPPPGGAAALPGGTAPPSPTERLRQYPQSVYYKLGQGGEPFPTYTVLSNRETYDTATKLIDADPQGMLREALDPDGSLRPQYIQAGMILERQAEQAGNEALFRQLNDALAIKATTLGQSTQILSTLGLSPAAMRLLVERMLQRAVQKAGKKGPAVEAAIEKRMAVANEVALQERAEAAAQKIIAEAEQALAAAQRKVVALERKPVLVNTLRKELDLLFGGETGAISISQRTISYEVAESIRERAVVIAAMPTGPERQTARIALLNELDAAADASAQTVQKAKVEVATKRLADQRARDLEYFMDASTRTVTWLTAADRAAVARAKTLLKKYGAELPEDLSTEWLDDAQALRGLEGDEAKTAIRGLLDEMKQYDPVKAKIEQRAAEVAEKKRIAKELEDLKILTGKLIPEAKVRAANIKRDMINRARQTVAKNALALPEDLAQAMMDNATEIADLPPGFQRDRRYQEFMQDVKNLLPPSKWNLALDLYGIPTTIKTAWDAGYMFRQGALLGFRHPSEWLGAWGPMLKSFADPVYARQIQDQLATRPLANLAHEAGLIFDEIWQANEFFSSKLAEKLKGVAGSQRSFVVPGNWIRSGSFDNVIRDWLPPGYDLNANPINSIADLVAVTGKTEQDVKDLALLYNALSGKSNIPWLRTQRGLLRLPFFAAGWASSIPEAVGRTAFSPGARKEGARVLAGYFGFVAGVELMGDIAGIWDAELDPRSSNFGKVRWKGTHEYTDPTLGLAGYLRTIAQILPTPTSQGWGQWHKNAAGVFKPTSTEGALGRLFRGKLHPFPGELWNWHEGQNIVGEKRRFTGLNAETALSVFNTAKSLFGPLTPVDIIEGIINDGLQGGVLSMSSIVGLNTASYITLNDVQQKVTNGMFPGKQYGQLDRGQQKQVNDSAEIKLELAKMEGPQLDMRAKVADRFDAYNKRNTEFELGVDTEPGLRDYAKAFAGGTLRGEVAREKVKGFKQNKYQAARALLTEDVLAYSTQGKEYQLHDVYAQLWLNVPLDEDIITGKRDYKKRDAERARILEQAQSSLKAAGRTSEYITKKGEGTFRGKYAEDPVVAKLLEEYERDQETLRPYWELRDTLLEKYPQLAAAQQQADAARQGGDIARANALVSAIDSALKLDDRKLMMRHRDPKIEAAYTRWGHGVPLSQRRAA